MARMTIWKAVLAVGLVCGSGWPPASLLAQGEFDCTIFDNDGPRCMFSVFPQLAVGGGFFTEITLLNQGYVDENLRLDFFGDDGTPLLVDLDGQPASQSIFVLQAGRSRRFQLELDSQAAIPGFARLTFPPTASIRGNLTFRVIDGGLLQTAVGVPAQIPVNNYSFPADVDLTQGIDTGLALANGLFRLVGSPDSGPQGIVVSLVNESGTVIETAIIGLGLNGHTSAFLSQVFPGLDNFQGTVSISAARDFGALALRLESGILTSVSVNDGPVFAAFDFSGAVAQTLEVEPNGTPANAQQLTLPAKIKGTVSAAFESDLFRFQATAGQILTAFVLTDGISPALDSYLALENATGFVFGLNSLNGLLNREDSFLRLEIPTTGQYILRIEDFFFEGGAEFEYNLLVRLDNP